MRSPIQWYGGKGQMVGKLLPLLPAHHVYVEPFGGGAAVLFAKHPAPVEVFNDVHSGLINFYRVLRDPEQFATFARLAQLTPYSREEWTACAATWEATADPVDRAWRWFVGIRQCFNGRAGWQMSVTESYGGAAHSVARWLAAVDRLPEAHARLQTVQVEHADWRRIFDQYDTSATLFYCDPPYVQETRAAQRYAYELTAADHQDLVARLLTVRGMVVVSGYAHAVYTPLEAAGWQRIDIVTAAHTVRTRGDGAGRRNAERVETVWRNPACFADLGPMFAGLEALG